MRVAAKGTWFVAAAVLFVQHARAQGLRESALEGEVVDAAKGRGIRGARVRIQSGEDEPMFATTDARGHFRFTGTGSGNYAVDAQYPGFIRIVEGYPQYITPPPMRATPGQPVRLEMRRYAAIVGKVVDAAGVPVEDMEMEALRRFPAKERHSSCGPGYVEGDFQYLAQQCVRTDDLGHYRLAPLAAGSYYVFVVPGMGFSPGTPQRDPKERPTFYPLALKPSEAKPVSVAAGKELRMDLRIIRRAGVKVTGRILGVPPGEGTGQLIAVGAVPLSPGASPSEADVDANGFAIHELLPGKYVIHAGQYASGFSSTSHPLATALRTVDVGTKDLAGVDLTLAPTPNVEGAVVFESGCPAVPVWIQVQGAGLRNVHAGADGKFVLEHLPPAKYRLYARPESGNDAFAKSAKLGDQEVLADGFETTAMTTGPLRITMACRGGGR